MDTVALGPYKAVTDLMKEAGGEGRPIDRNFSGIRPSAQGKILLTFVPVKGMACVNGIEVVEESK